MFVFVYYTARENACHFFFPVILEEQIGDCEGIGLKKNSWGIRILTVLTGLTILGGNGLWLAELAGGRRDIVVLCGAALGALGVLLFAALNIVLHRRRSSEADAHQMELAALTAEHRRELASVNAQNKKTIESFRSTLSHSLRMPIAIIQGYAELLAGDMVTSPEVRREYLEKIVQRSQYMTDTMSRHFHGEETMDSSKLTCRDMDLLQLIRQAATDMQTAASEKSVSIQVLSAEETLAMRADAYLLNRVMFNLLENALKYMGRPGTITIRVQKLESYASVTVRDDGIGLSAAETVSIFERNFQGSNHAGQSGHGYGLYLVKQTVEAHGGQVTAKSDLGQGMSITLTIPLHPSYIAPL